MDVSPVILSGDHVQLRPLAFEDLDALCQAGLHESLWKLTTTDIKTKADMQRYIESALNDHSRGVAMPFVTIDAGTGTVVGSTRFGNIDKVNRKSEIGWTWISPEWQRTHVNTEAKLLMLAHAFEVWSCIRVELKTDVLNERSRNAILRLGAVQEGIHRNHMITDTGRFRDSVFFSIIDDEWPGVRSNLVEKLRRGNV
ncbi:MAG: GNAT family protein [Acidobacteriota bacterium]